MGNYFDVQAGKSLLHGVVVLVVACKDWRGRGGMQVRYDGTPPATLARIICKGHKKRRGDGEVTSAGSRISIPVPQKIFV